MDTKFNVGDRVYIALGTLAWTAEKALRNIAGEIVEVIENGDQPTRYSVKFNNGKTLKGRDGTTFRKAAEPGSHGHATSYEIREGRMIPKGKA